VKESFRRRVKSELRLKCKEFVESDDVYRFRGLIENIFGEIKQDVGSYERTRNFHIARLFVLAKFILFNLGFSFWRSGFFNQFHGVGNFQTASLTPTLTKLTNSKLFSMNLAITYFTALLTIQKIGKSLKPN